MHSNDLSLPGIHNTYNSMAAAIAARYLEVRDEDIRDALQTFEGVEHRLEKVCKYKNFTFVNDSKSTNINSAWYALNSFKSTKIIWIAGGEGDNNDYSYLNKPVKDNVDTIISLGKDSQRYLITLVLLNLVFKLIT